MYPQSTTSAHVCSVDGCERPVLARSLCAKHYKIVWRRDGPNKPNVRGTPAEKLRAHTTQLGPDECWPFAGYTDKDGYGRIPVSDHSRVHYLRATHVAYELHTGAPVPDSMLIMHTCDNPPCVNPNHLRLGTVLENNRDRAEKDRSCQGERHTQTQLTEELVREIRRMYATGAYSQQKIANQFGISQATVGRIVRRIWWKHVS